MCITSSLIAAKLYWFWKGPLIQHYFGKLRDGRDILIFSNSDVMDGWGWTHKLLKTMLSKNNSFALYETDFLEHPWTKQDILKSIAAMPYPGRPVHDKSSIRQICLSLLNPRAPLAFFKIG
jgi:hypothetical protein